MILENQTTEIIDSNNLFEYTVINEKIKYSFKILKKFEQIYKLKNYSNITDLFFMITHLQTKYMYDIELILKRRKHIATINYKKSYKKLNDILIELKKNHTNHKNVSFNSILDLYTNWINEQQEIDTELVNLLKLS